MKADLGTKLDRDYLGRKIHNAIFSGLSDLIYLF